MGWFTEERSCETCDLVAWVLSLQLGTNKKYSSTIPLDEVEEVDWDEAKGMVMIDALVKESWRSEVVILGDDDWVWMCDKDEWNGKSVWV